MTTSPLTRPARRAAPRRTRPITHPVAAPKGTVPFGDITYPVGATLAGDPLQCRLFEPAANPAWDRYEHGLRATYRSYDVEHAVGDLSAGQTAFAAVLEAPEGVIGGLRLDLPSPCGHLPLVHELGHHSSCSHLADLTAARAAHGIVECKGLWLSGTHAGTPGLSVALCRAGLHAARLGGFRWISANAAPHTLPVAQDVGYVADDQAAGIPYPSERYRSTVIWVDLRAWGQDADPVQQMLLAQERELIESQR